MKNCYQKIEGGNKMANQNQNHLPNPQVNRTDRKRILEKRVRHLETLELKYADKRYARLQNYKNELTGL
jgi:hypothetical protein